MVLTLYKYVFRELLKTFLLTALGLTAVLVTCGGIYNLTQMENLSLGEILILFSIIVPLFAAFTVPLAALFSATLTYGRFSADNEINACRSSGVNVLHLLWPGITLSLFAAVCTFILFGWVIPSIFSRVSEMQQAGVKAYLKHTLASGRAVEFRNRYLHADDVQTVSSESLSSLQEDAFVLQGVSFLETNSDQSLHIVGMADSAAIRFDTTGLLPAVRADLCNIRGLDMERHLPADFEHLQLGPFELPVPGTRRISYLRSAELLAHWQHPEQVLTRAQKRYSELRKVILKKLTYDYFASALSADSLPCELALDGSRIAITQATLSPDPLRESEEAVSLALRDIAVIDETSDAKRQYEASHGELKLRYRDDDTFDLVLILSKGVVVLDPDIVGQKRAISSRSLGPFSMPKPVRQLFDNPAYQAASLYQADNKLNLGDDIEKIRKDYRKRHIKSKHGMLSEFHVRIVYSLSVIFVALLGAVLGIVIRGGQALVAFGISAGIASIVVLMTIMGKQVAKGEHTLEVGLGLIWAGLLVIVLMNVVVIKKWLPR